MEEGGPTISVDDMKASFSPSDIEGGQSIKQIQQLVSPEEAFAPESQEKKSFKQKSLDFLRKNSDRIVNASHEIAASTFTIAALATLAEGDEKRAAAFAVGATFFTAAKLVKGIEIRNRNNKSTEEEKPKRN